MNCNHTDLSVQLYGLSDAMEIILSSLNEESNRDESIPEGIQATIVYNRIPQYVTALYFLHSQLLELAEQAKELDVMKLHTDL